MPLNLLQDERSRSAFKGVLLTGLVVILGAAISCGGDSEPTVELVIEADLAALPSDADPDEVMDLAAEIIEKRVEALAFDGHVTIDRPDRILVELSGIDGALADKVADLIGKTAKLEFRAPVINDEHLVVCTDLDGEEFAVLGVQVSEGTCIGTGQTGTVQWIPATARDSTGVERVLTGAFIEPGGAEDLVTPERPGQCSPACLRLDFTAEGALLFEQVTSELVNFPLAIFLDEDLIGAPNVAQAISGGTAVIGGLDEDEAEALAIQINAGTLPVQIDVVAVHTGGDSSRSD